MVRHKTLIFVLAALLGSASLSAQQDIEETAREALEAQIAADPVLRRGAFVYGACKVCHATGEDQRSVAGPNLTGIFDRAAASDPDYDQYSIALKTSGIEWSEDLLDEWLTDPYGFLPGNRMSFIGVRDPDDRAALIEYLKLISSLPREAS